MQLVLELKYKIHFDKKKGVNSIISINRALL